LTANHLSILVMARLLPAAGWSDLADIQLHIIESYLPCRDKVAFLSINGQAYRALKDGNCFRKYRQHFCSSNEYHLSWASMPLAEKGSFYLPSMDSVRVHCHKVNVTRACGACRHRIDDTAPLLPSLYIPTPTMDAPMHPDHSHNCKVGHWTDIRQILRNEQTFRCDFSPAVMEYYLFTLGQVKKYTTLLCSPECEDKFIESLNETYGDMGWATVVTALDQIVQIDADTAVASLVRRITLPPSVEVAIHWYNCGIIKDFRFNEKSPTITRSPQQCPLTIHGQSLLLLHGDCETSLQNVRNLKNLQRQGKQRQGISGHTFAGLQRPHLSAEETFFYAKMYFGMEVLNLPVMDLETGEQLDHTREYAYEVIYSTNEHRDEWQYHSLVMWDGVHDYYETLILHSTLGRRDWMGALSPIDGTLSLAGHTGVWQVVAEAPGTWDHDHLLSDESVSDIGEGTTDSEEERREFRRVYGERPYEQIVYESSATESEEVVMGGYDTQSLDSNDVESMDE